MQVSVLFVSSCSFFRQLAKPKFFLRARRVVVVQSLYDLKLVSQGLLLMFSRILGIPVLLGAAIGVPYVATNGPDLESLWPSPQQAENSGNGSGDREALLPGGSRVPRVANVTLHEAFRFDISREWVYQRWERKSTALSKLGLYGIRVALVTGTELHDVAGSLTYLFGQDGRVQQISFRGRTGDTTQLVMLASSRYGLQPQPTAIVGEQLFQVRRGEHVFSELRTRPNSVLRSSSLHDSFLVNLELQHPDATTPLPIAEFGLPNADSEVKKIPQPETKIPDPKADEDASEEQTVKKRSGREAWKAFFPRSRVPNEQIESLESRGRLW